MYLGIDPGKTGALALINPDGFIRFTAPFPGTPQEARRILFQYRKDIKLGVIEHVHAFPKAGVSGMFNFGANFGMWQGLLAGIGVSYILVRPQTWQRKVIDSAKKGDPKKVTMDFIRRRYPRLVLKKSQHGEADAICMALYARIVDSGRA